MLKILQIAELVATGATTVPMAMRLRRLLLQFLVNVVNEFVRPVGIVARFRIPDFSHSNPNGYIFTTRIVRLCNPSFLARSATAICPVLRAFPKQIMRQTPTCPAMRVINGGRDRDRGVFDYVLTSTAKPELDRKRRTRQEFLGTGHAGVPRRAATSGHERLSAQAAKDR